MRREHKLDPLAYSLHTNVASKRADLTPNFNYIPNTDTIFTLKL